MNIIIASTGDVSISPTLISAFISAAVSFFVFALTQLFLAVRSNHELLTSKLEELWISLNSVIKNTRPYTGNASNLDKAAADSINDRATTLVESLLDPTAQIALHFPELNEKYHEITHACHELAKLMRNPPAHSTDGVSRSESDLYVDTLAINIWIKELGKKSELAKSAIGDLLIYLRINKNDLTKSPLSLLRCKCRCICGQ